MKNLETREVFTDLKANAILILILLTVIVLRYLMTH